MEPLTIAAFVSALAALLGWFTDSQRKAKTEPVAAITQGAATLATALETVVGPLRDEVILLREENANLRAVVGKLERRVGVLTKALVDRGIPVPVD